MKPKNVAFRDAPKCIPYKASLFLVYIFFTIQKYTKLSSC
jgi:hypothetical protein